MPDPLSLQPLVALVHATAHWSAGVPPHCTASARLLDDVHVHVHAGDCLVVHHDDPASARVLLAALSDHRALRVGHRFTGERRCAPGVRVRRCSIDERALPAVQSGWREGRRRVTANGTWPGTTRARRPLVHLLRLSRSHDHVMDTTHEWHAWARREASAGGAVVLVTRPKGHGADSATRPLAPANGADSLHERRPPAYDSAHFPPMTETREVRLHLGRLCALDTWE